VDYFLTGAISSVSGFEYLSGAVPGLEAWLIPGACAAIAFLGLLNTIGIRESASLTALLAVASLAVNLALIGVVAVQLDAQQWQLVWQQFRSAGSLPLGPMLAGFGSSW